MLRVVGDGMVCGQYDPATGVLSDDGVAAHTGPAAGSQRVDGWYRRLGGTLVVFYFAERRVWLRIGEVTRWCASPASVDWVRQANGMARLSLLGPAGHVASVVYFGADASGVPPEVDFTMTDSEDFDFGEFVRRKLDDEPRLRAIAGADLRYDAAAEAGPAARHALTALAEPAVDGDLGPLLRIVPAQYRELPIPSLTDDELLGFVLALDAAPAAGMRGLPPVMPLALALTDRERETLQFFAKRTAQRAMHERDSELLVPAALATVLGGLDCAIGSPSLHGALLAADEVARATKRSGLPPTG